MTAHRQPNRPQSEPLITGLLHRLPDGPRILHAVGKRLLGCQTMIRHKNRRAGACRELARKVAVGGGRAKNKSATVQIQDRPIRRCSGGSAPVALHASQRGSLVSDAFGAGNACDHLVISAPAPGVRITGP